MFDSKLSDALFVAVSWFCAFTIEPQPHDFYLFDVSNLRDFLLGWAFAESLWWLAHLTRDI